MPVYALDQLFPSVHESSWIADSATVIGNVHLAAETSVWFGCVLRGDNEPLVIGRGTNIQEGTVLHTDVGFPLTLGEHVTVGHQVMLHGCTIGDGSLIGIQAVVLNGARIGRNCLVGAGSLVTEGKEFPEGSLILGSPAKAVRRLEPDEVARIGAAAHRYVRNAQRYRLGLRHIG